MPAAHFMSKAGRHGEAKPHDGLGQMLAVRAAEANVKVTALNIAVAENRKRDMADLLRDLEILRATILAKCYDLSLLEGRCFEVT